MIAYKTGLDPLFWWLLQLEEGADVNKKENANGCQRQKPLWGWCATGEQGQHERRHTHTHMQRCTKYVHCTYSHAHPAHKPAGIKASCVDGQLHLDVAVSAAHNATSTGEGRVWKAVRLNIKDTCGSHAKHEVWQTFVGALANAFDLHMLMQDWSRRCAWMM